MLQRLDLLPSLGHPCSFPPDLGNALAEAQGDKPLPGTASASWKNQGAKLGESEDTPHPLPAGRPSGLRAVRSKGQDKEVWVWTWSPSPH